MSSASGRYLKADRAGIAFPYHQLNPQDSNAPGAAFQYQKVFGDSHFLAAGVIYLPVEGKKPGKNSKDNSYVGLEWLSRTRSGREGG